MRGPVPGGALSSDERERLERLLFLAFPVEAAHRLARQASRRSGR